MFIDDSGDIDFPSHEPYHITQRVERVEEKVDDKNPPNKRKKCLIIIIVISVIIILAVGIFLVIYFSLKKEENGGSIKVSLLTPKQGTYKIFHKVKNINDDDFEVTPQIYGNNFRLLDIPINEKSEQNYQTLGQGNHHLIIKFKKTLTSMEGMFANIQELKSVDFSEFSSKKVVNINNLFRNCTNLEEVIFQNFDSKKLETMDNSFENCSKLTVLDLSSFSTPKLYSMSSAFKGCTNLLILNLQNFIFDSKINMDDATEGCDSLIKVDSPSDNKDIIKPNKDIKNFPQCGEGDNTCDKCEQKNIGNDLNISICVSCPKRFFLNNISVYPLKCNQCLENCIQCYSEYNCKLCEDNYEFDSDNNKCVEKIVSTELIISTTYPYFE